MLGVLALFLGQMLNQTNDTRILLAELLIQLQVLHTFDLPKRKDLGYSAIIGLILIAVAATISETNLFGLFLFFFLGIAIPVLLLDYRSRLQIKAGKWAFKASSIRRFGILLLAITMLGLTVFALMPRLPGYQLKIFPVSAPIDVQGNFDNQKIVNPGYVKPGKGKAKANQGQSDGQTFDSDLQNNSVTASTAYYGFNAEIDQSDSSQGGGLKPQDVMRVRTQSPGFWRVLAFDSYTGKGWKISENEDTQTLRRHAWSYLFKVPQAARLGQRKEVVQTYSILADLPNLIPAMSDARHLYFPTQEIAIDRENGLRSPVPLEEGLTYTVVSDVAYRDRTQLQTASETYTQSIQKKYLQLPRDISPRIRETTLRLLKKAETPPTTASEKALLLAQQLKQLYQITPNVPALNAGQDMVDAFLHQNQGGYPDQFSTALTVMLRSVGIPARLVTGFAPGTFNPFTGMYVVKNIDAYALTEVYFPRYGWFAFDPIPGHPLIPPSIEETERFPLLGKLWHWAAGWFPSPLKNTFNQVWLWVVSILAGLLGLAAQGWVGMGLLLLIGVAIALISWGIWLLAKYLRHRKQMRSLAPMSLLYTQMLRVLKQKGYTKDAAMTPLEFIELLEKEGKATNLDAIKAISRAYIQWHYGGQTQNLDYLKQQLNGLAHRSKAHRSKV